MIFTVEGDPVAKARHRTFIRNKTVRTYDVQHDEKLNVQVKLRNQLREKMKTSEKEEVNKIFLEKNFFELNIIFYMQIPRSLSKKKKLLLDNKPHSSKPDLDNLIKFILDCSNEILFHDDSMIFRITAKKIYSQNPGTVLEMKIFNHEKGDHENVFCEITK